MNEALIKMIQNQVKTQVDNNMYKNGVMRLGSFIQGLKGCDPEADIQFDFYGYVPTTLDSYRGYYDHLAFGFADTDIPKVKDVLAQCEDALGKTFEGYKGGDFTMSEDTPLWVGNYGESRSTAIVDILKRDRTVIISTAYVD